MLDNFIPVITFGQFHFTKITKQKSNSSWGTESNVEICHAVTHWVWILSAVSAGCLILHGRCWSAFKTRLWAISVSAHSVSSSQIFYMNLTVLNGAQCLCHLALQLTICYHPSLKQKYPPIQPERDMTNNKWDVKLTVSVKKQILSGIWRCSNSYNCNLVKLLSWLHWVVGRAHWDQLR